MVLCRCKATKLICCTAQLPTAGCKRPVVMQWHFKLRERETLCLVSTVHLNVITSSYKAWQWFKAYRLLNIIKIFHQTRITKRCITANKNYVQLNSSIKKLRPLLLSLVLPFLRVQSSALGLVFRGCCSVHSEFCVLFSSLRRHIFSRSINITKHMHTMMDIRIPNHVFDLHSVPMLVLTSPEKEKETHYLCAHMHVLTR